jgi:hypothetical protein
MAYRAIHTYTTATTKVESGSNAVRLRLRATALLRLIERWRNEAVRSGRPISRITLAY